MCEYGVVTTNKFHFLSDDEGADPSEILGKAAEIKKAKGTSISKVPQSTAPVSTNLPKPEKPQTETANKENSASRGRGRGRGNGREGGRDNRREEGGQRDVGTEGERKFDGERRGRGRGRGGNFNGERRHDGERREEGERRFAGGERKFDRERRPRQEGDGERKFDRERRPRPPRQEGDVAPVEGEERTDFDRRPTRGGRGRGRGNFTGDRSDRSGVPRGGAPKKEGHGKGNWGTEQDELQGETEPVVVDGTTTDVEKQHPAAKEEDKNDSGVEVEKEEEKPVGLTLEEWKQKNKAVETESFNVRKPNDDKKLNLAPLKKTEDAEKDNEEFVVLRKEKTREKHVDISVNFATAERERGYGGNRDGFRGRGSDRGERGGRGNRGGDRPNRGGERRGGDRANTRGGNNQFNLSTDQFPALGGH